MRTTPFWSAIIAMALFCVLVPACGAPAVDTKALEATVEARLIATQTASAPTALPTPAIAPTRDILSQIPPKTEYKHYAIIASQYDKFKDQTMVILPPNRYDANDRPVEFAAAWFHKGEAVTPPTSILFQFSVTAKDWQWLSVRNMTLLLDGAIRLSLTAQREGKVNSGSSVSVTENLFLELTLTQFLQVVNVKTVEFQIANKSYALTESELNGLRDLASRMKP